ncbi:hypothetical protein [Jiella sp. KSK16Y-1]|uniref:Uncharacterized protein n=1 Tax=Jiella mangrovi TaxID=2821407 RepID=A0ABS4BDZ8_9HYPH|nr:hypothetical protein [Jiella mangrovi]
MLLSMLGAAIRHEVWRQQSSIGAGMRNLREAPNLPAGKSSDRPGEPFLGTGKCSQGPAVAALANAEHDAAGIRIYDLPCTPERLRAALCVV